MPRCTRLVLCLCGSLLVALVACVPPEGTPDLSRRFNETSRMGEIQASGSLRIGVPTGSPPFASGSERAPRGFTVDLGRLIADTMGVEPRFSMAPFPVLRGRLEQEELDIAFSLDPLTEETFREDPFTDPYYLGHQRLLVPRSSQIAGAEDLAGDRVCFYAPQADMDVSRLASGVQVIDAFDIGECVRLLARARVEAFAAQDVWLLAGMTESHAGATRRYSIVGDQLSTEGYGIAAAPGAGAFIEYLNNLLSQAEEDGTWVRSYDRWLAPYLREPATPPELSAEEAASLYPEGG